MAEVNCSDLGTNCEYVAEAESPVHMQEVVINHAEDVHPDFIENLNPDMEAELAGVIARAFAR